MVLECQFNSPLFWRGKFDLESNERISKTMITGAEILKGFQPLFEESDLLKGQLKSVFGFSLILSIGLFNPFSNAS